MAAVTLQSVTTTPERGHVVQFYRDEGFLCAAAANFLSVGLQSGCPTVVIATRRHGHGIQRGLRSLGAEVDEALHQDRLVILDAEETLSRLLLDEWPDPARFDQIVGGLVRSLAERFPAPVVRAYGEMVDLLAARGRHDAAIRLEQLWNGLCADVPVSLLCAYSMTGFRDSSHGAPFASVCDVHSHVVPTESTTVSEEPARMREIALLEQRAEALQGEIERRRSLEAALRSSLDEAQRLNRVKDEFLAIVSHELRTPLNAILGWSAVLRSSAEGELARAAETIERNARAQARLVEDMLDMSSVMSGQLKLVIEPVDLARLLRDVAEVLAPTGAAKGVTLEVSTEPAACPYMGDPRRLHQVAWHLMSNAVKFTPAGGRVVVRLEPSGNEVVLVVSDTGAGIRADFLPYVFERFRQADGSTTRAYGGLGLGLAMVRHLVELHGGTVAAYSDGENKGAVFRVTLPRHTAATAALKKA